MDEETCQNDAAFRFTWPGYGESYICSEHARVLSSVSKGLGVYVQLIEVSPGFTKCRQVVTMVEDEQDYHA